MQSYRRIARREWLSKQRTHLVSSFRTGINSSIAFIIAAIRVASRRRLVLPPVVPLKHRLNAHELRDGRMKLPPQKSNDVQTTFHLVFPELPPDSFSCYREFLVSSIDQLDIYIPPENFQSVPASATTTGQDLEHLDIRGNPSTRKLSCSS